MPEGSEATFLKLKSRENEDDDDDPKTDPNEKKGNIIIEVDTSFSWPHPG